MKALIVGFGGMGCRHASSLFNGNLFTEIWILEPSFIVFQENCLRIGIETSSFFYVNEINKLPENIDFAIIATTSIPRLSIFKSLVVDKRIKLFVLEKVLFQSKNQFEEAIDLINKHNVKAYCNFVNRYFPNYCKIKESINNDSQIQMIVSGGEFGLGCNSLHYIDLFQYLISSKPKIKKYKLLENTNPHKRGSKFKEVAGQIIWESEKNDILIINSQLGKATDVEISITFNGNIHILNEGIQTHITYRKDENLEVNKFEILFTSYLTNEIFKDILSNFCKLPLIEETKYIHCQLFESINNSLEISIFENCPIT